MDAGISLAAGLVLTFACNHIPKSTEERHVKDEDFLTHFLMRDLRKFMKTHNWLFGIIFTTVFLAVLSTN